MINKKLIIKEKRSNKYLSLGLGGALLLLSGTFPWNSTFAQENAKIYNQNYQKQRCGMLSWIYRRGLAQIFLLRRAWG
ncbi:hypothetical protein KUH03_02255 [Sphingobacterium sp. E70]|uniref:hypothetical protein n=1 Tax=Sphingobacterium sp. E70 TaxID=2853439 RepID=UPI00211D01AD|nr:hypothetical protein [Sphingobacterium sp. E70]ULT25832.1 hypothetical protein KUH03_02255 [Sphingobacterium sp. E70]